jgi:hypothetical protein
VRVIESLLYYQYIYSKENARWQLVAGNAIKQILASVHYQILAGRIFRHAGSQFLGGHCRKNVTEAELPSSDD